MAMDVGTKQLQWDLSNPRKPVARSDSFWQLYGAVKARLEATTDLMVKTGIVNMHPDRAPAEIHLRMAWSLFAQGWMPVLAPQDVEKMLVLTKLKGDYVSVEEPRATSVKCSGCGTEKRAPLGAKRVVCETCGKTNDLGAASLPCPQCGAPLTFPPGAKSAQCTHCKLDVRAMRHG